MKTMEKFYIYISKRNHYVHENKTINKIFIFDTVLTQNLRRHQQEATQPKIHNTNTYHASIVHKNIKFNMLENLKMNCSNRNILY